MGFQLLFGGKPGTDMKRMPQKLNQPHATPSVGIRNAAPPSWGRPLPMPTPRTSPGYPDIHGRRRMKAEFDRLTDEILQLEEELKLVEGFCPASMCCKEVMEFTDLKSDPLVPSYKPSTLQVRGQAVIRRDRSFGEHSIDSDDSCCSCSLFRADPHGN